MLSLRTFAAIEGPLSSWEPRPTNQPSLIVGSKGLDSQFFHRLQGQRPYGIRYQITRLPEPTSA